MKRLVAFALVVAVAAGAWNWWRSDRRRIERALDRLERACEKDGPESPLSLVGRARTLLDSFAPGLLVRAAPYAGTISDGRELVGLIERYRSTASRVRIADEERRLEVGSNGTAEMGLIVRVDGVRAGGPGREAFRARLFWVRTDDGWKIREIEVLEVLQTTGLFF
jgi:hypothetical protein